MGKRGQKLSEEAILDAFRDSHGNRYRYPPFPEEFTVHSIVSVVCSIHGEFRQSILHHMRGQGCPRCAHAKINEGNRLNRFEWIRRFESMHGRGKYDYSKVPESLRQDTKVEIFCPEHNVYFYQTPIQHWRLQQGCPKCGTGKGWERRKQN
jgi:Zn finger protein HypA/HybF involved in hydrogenase expression